MKSEHFLYLIGGLIIAYIIFRESETIMTAGKGLLEKMADAIQRFEGFTPGSVAYRNNNPGNLKYFGGEKWQGQIGVDKSGFIIFDTYSNGRRALTKLLTNAATGALAPSYLPTMTLLQFFSRYAPTSDANNPTQYAEFVARELNVDPMTPISELV